MTRESFLFFNETIFREERSGADAAAAYESFVNAFGMCRDSNGDIKLVTVASIHELSRSEELSFRDWGRIGANRDKWRSLALGLAGDPSACWALRDVYLSDSFDAASHGVSVPSAVAAIKTGTPLISCGRVEEWPPNNATLAVVEALDHEIVESEILHPHIWNRASAEAFWEADAEIGSYESLSSNPADMWDRRAELFPRLEFLDIAESDVKGIAEDWFAPLERRLRELDRVTAAWDTGAAATPTWQSSVSPESQSRRDKFWFLDGENRHLFEWHARFTPRYGRIYFRMLRERGVLRIAHVGEHR